MIWTPEVEQKSSTTEYTIQSGADGATITTIQHFKNTLMFRCKTFSGKEASPMKNFSAMVSCPLVSLRSGTTHNVKYAGWGVLALALAMAPGGMSKAHAAELSGSFKGNSFTAFANAEAGPVAGQLAQSAYQPCPCRGTNGQVLSSTVNTIRAGDNGKVLSADSTISTVYTNQSGTRGLVRNTATVTQLNLFNGLITANSIKAVASVSATPTAISTDINNSVFNNLRIGGNLVDPGVAANTQITLAGLGKVTLKKLQRRGDLSDLGRVSVEMLAIDITQLNSFGLPAGSQIVVASASATFARSQPEKVVGENKHATFISASMEIDVPDQIGTPVLTTRECGDAGGELLSKHINTVITPNNANAPGTSVRTAFRGSQDDVAVARPPSASGKGSMFGGLIGA